MDTAQTRPTVAIVGEHALFRDGLVRLMAAEWDVSWAGPTLISFWLSNVPAELVIIDLDTDLTGPGREAVQAVIRTGTHILLVSSMSNPIVARSALKAGAIGLVTKLNTGDEFLDAARSVHAGRRWISDSAMTILNTMLDSDDMKLTRQERKVLTLYASGMKADSVGRMMGLSTETVYYYLKRVRAKLAEAGYPAPGQIDLHRRAIELGLVTSEELGQVGPGL